VYLRRLPGTSCTHYSVHSRPKYSAGKTKKRVGVLFVIYFINVSYVLLAQHSNVQRMAERPLKQY